MNVRRARPVGSLEWFAVPLLAAFAAALVLATPVRIAGWQAPEPVFAMAPVFAWAAVRPQVLAPLAVAVSGLLLDLLWGGPPGVWTFSLLAAFALVFFARQFVSGLEFIGQWAVFAAACLLAETVGLTLTTMRAGHVPDLLGAGLQFAVDSALFPFAWKMIERYEASDTRYVR